MCVQSSACRKIGWWRDKWLWNRELHCDGNDTDPINNWSDHHRSHHFLTSPCREFTFARCLVSRDSRHAPGIWIYLTTSHSNSLGRSNTYTAQLQLFSNVVPISSSETSSWCSGPCKLKSHFPLTHDSGSNTNHTMSFQLSLWDLGTKMAWNLDTQRSYKTPSFLSYLQNHGSLWTFRVPLLCVWHDKEHHAKYTCVTRLDNKYPHCMHIQKTSSKYISIQIVRKGILNLNMRNFYQPICGTSFNVPTAAG